MFEKLKDLYQVQKRINKTALEKAVKKGWITKEQMKEIIGEQL